MMVYNRSIGKIGEGQTCEDASMSRSGVAAVSDGAGGGGVYADLWAQYLVSNIPDTPFNDARQLDEWIGDIYEPFYDRCEERAKEKGGLVLDKFYDEGSFATLAAAWRMSRGSVQWVTYGDSVVFHYNWQTGLLEYSDITLNQFSQPPYLLNYINESIDSKGFRLGTFNVTQYSTVFICSDALSHYIIMMYMLSKHEQYAEDLQKALLTHSRNTNYIMRAMAMECPDFKHLLSDMLSSLFYPQGLEDMLKPLVNDGLLAVDDYSVSILN